MNPEAHQDISRLFDEIKPASVLIIGPKTAETLNFGAQPGSDISRLSHDELSRLEEQQRYDAGIIFDTLEHLDKARGGTLISRLRDVYCRRLLIAVNTKTPEKQDTVSWHDTDFIAYGLTRLKTYQDGHCLYEYNILNYKNTPDWLNAKNWANPELWGKYRW